MVIAVGGALLALFVSGQMVQNRVLPPGRATRALAVSTVAGGGVHGDDLFRVTNHRKVGFTVLILLIFLILLFVCVLPRWGYDQNWGHRSSGLLGLLPVAVPILLPLGYSPRGF